MTSSAPAPDRTGRPSPLRRLLARTTLPETVGDLRAHFADTTPKTLVGLLLCPVLVTLTLRLGDLRVTTAVLARFTPAKLDQLYPWYGVFAVHVALLYVVPVLVIKLGLREPLAAYGHQLRPLARLWPLVLLFLAVMLPVTYLASRGPPFDTFYPLYRGARQSVRQFALFEGGFFLVFFTQEFFFRGFLIEVLKPKFGTNAIFIASALYGVAHYAKPLPEQLGAFVVGVVLGFVGERHRTFYFGVVVHYAIALSMDAYLCLPSLLR